MINNEEDRSLVQCDLDCLAGGLCSASSICTEAKCNALHLKKKLKLSQEDGEFLLGSLALKKCKRVADFILVLNIMCDSEPALPLPLPKPPEEVLSSFSSGRDEVGWAF